MSDEIDHAKLEEERLMRALSRQGKPSPRPVVVKKADTATSPVSPRKEEKPEGAVPAWKKAQLEREAEEKRRRDEEARRKEEQAKLIEERVKEFGLGANQEDENIEKFLTSPRGTAERPSIEEQPAFQDPAAPRETVVQAEREEELAQIPSYDERGQDERAAKEEERLMRMIGATK